jgi:hypothetical protein
VALTVAGGGQASLVDFRFATVPEPSLAPPTYTNLTPTLPLKPYCRAQQWGRSVFLYAGTQSHPGLACFAIIDLDEGEEASAEAVYLKCPPAAWKLVSGWKPWD